MNDNIVSALVDVLTQGEDLLEILTDTDYAQAVPEAFGASVGAHYRHHLDHVHAWLNPDDREVIDYDARARDPQLETDRTVALARTRALVEACHRTAPDRLRRATAVRCSVAREEDAPLVASSVAREAVNVIVHGIHHYALIAIICRMRRIDLPDGFGVAPSTAKHRHDLARTESMATNG